MRYALYFTPERDHPLSRIAAGWLGRDAFTGGLLPPPHASAMSPAEIAFHTASARRYGFHATLKAPFQLARGRSEAELAAAVASASGVLEPVTIPRLRIGRVDGFFALVPEPQLPDLTAFAATVVRTFEPFRAPLSDTEIERRNPDALSPAQFRNLCQWGYPYIFDDFRFHMTLTGRVGHAEAPRIEAAMAELFDPCLAEPVSIDNLALFVEPEPGAPFLVHSLHRLGTARERKRA